MSLAVAGNVDLNKAHDQALDMWKNITQKQERQLTCFFQNELEQSIHYYGTVTYSEKCHTIRAADGVYGEELKPKDIGYVAWDGHQRIASVSSFFVETHSGEDTKYDEAIRKYARNIIIFRCYSLVSRQGENDIVVSAESHNGLSYLSASNLYGSVDFDYTKQDGGLSEILGNSNPFLKPSRLWSQADFALDNSFRASYLNSFAKLCYSNKNSAREQSSSSKSNEVEGKSYEIAAAMSGRFDCLSDIIIRYAI